MSQTGEAILFVGVAAIAFVGGLLWGFIFGRQSVIDRTK